MPSRRRLASQACAIRSGASPSPPGSETGKRHLVASTTSSRLPREPRRERLLRAAVGVGVGGVDEVAAGVEEAIEHPVRLVGGRLAAHQHRAEAQAADGERAERGRLHSGARTRDRRRRCVTICAPMPDLLPGAEIAGCRIEAVAGRGGMGIVYRATQLSLGRPVAVKLIAPDRAGDPGFRERFERESRVAAAIDHPNVIPVYAAGEEGGHLYLVMRYVKGTDLQGLLARERPAARRRASRRSRCQVGAALDAAHAVGLVHRDVKPANVLLSGEHAYLADFGLSQVVGTDTRLTSTGQWIGTVDFMAPEQFSGERGRRARGRLRARLRALRRADRRGPVPARDRAGDDARAPARRAAAADRGRRRRAGRLRPRDRPRARQGPRATATRRPATSAARRSPPPRGGT